jgi:hypothetical protein
MVPFEKWGGRHWMKTIPGGGTRVTSRVVQPEIPNLCRCNKVLVNQNQITIFKLLSRHVQAVKNELSLKVGLNYNTCLQKFINAEAVLAGESSSSATQSLLFEWLIYFINGVVICWPIIQMLFMGGISKRLKYLVLSFPKHLPSALLKYRSFHLPGLSL